MNPLGVAEAVAHAVIMAKRRANPEVAVSDIELPELSPPARRCVEVSGQSFLVDPTPGMWSRCEVEAFARLAVLAERERCATVCEAERDRILSKQGGQVGDLGDAMLRQVAHMGAEACAAVIRSPVTPTILPASTAEK